MKTKATKLQISYVIEHFSSMSDKELVLNTGLSFYQIRRLAFKYSLAKSEQRWSEAQRAKAMITNNKRWKKDETDCQ